MTQEYFLIKIEIMVRDIHQFIEDAAPLLKELEHRTFIKIDGAFRKEITVVRVKDIAEVRE